MTNVFKRKLKYLNATEAANFMASQAPNVHFKTKRNKKIKNKNEIKTKWNEMKYE